MTIESFVGSAHSPHEPISFVVDIADTGERTTLGSPSLQLDRGPRNRPPDGLRVASSGWNWDGSTLRAFTGDAGLVPLFYTAGSRYFAISTSLLALRDRFGDCELDWPGITICLALGHYVADDTPFRELKALPLGATLKWCDGSLEVTQPTWDFPAVDADFEHAVDGYRAEVSSAVKRNLTSGAAGMGLSGGRDSRHILLELLARHDRPQLVVTSNHYLALPEADTAVATQLARQAGIPMSVLDPPPDRLSAELQKNQITEFLTLSHSWALPLAESLSGLPSRQDGMNAGVLFGRSGLVNQLRSRFGSRRPRFDGLVDAAVEVMLDGPLVRVDSLVREGVLTDETRAEAGRRLRSVINPYADFANPAQAFLHFNHTTRDTAVFTYGMFANDEVACPFDDPELVRFALGLPWDVSTDGMLQSVAVRAEYGAYADVPFAEELPDATSSTKWDAKKEASTAARLLEVTEDSQGRLLSDRAHNELRTGKTALRNVQVAAYLLQLVNLHRETA